MGPLWCAGRRVGGRIGGGTAVPDRVGGQASRRWESAPVEGAPGGRAEMSGPANLTDGGGGIREVLGEGGGGADQAPAIRNRPILTCSGMARTLKIMDYSRIITVEPGKRSGKPCIRGMRITVSDVLGYLAEGMSEDEVLRDFPYLTREDIRACLAFTADRERRISVAAE
jgi:uncharacterized protein (DUF433 family)